MSARKLHRWLGLLLGGWFLVLGLTGAVLVYWHALEAVELPRPSGGESLPLQTLLDRAARHMDDIPWRIFPADEHRDHALAIFLTDEGRRTLYLNPANGEVQGALPWRGAAVHWLYDLHANALAGSAGKLLVGLTAIPLLLGLAMGLRLWLRRGAVTLRESLRPVRGLRGRRRLSHWHRVLGIWAFLPLLLAVGSGLPVSFPDTTRLVLQPLLAPSPPFQGPATKGAGPVDLDGAVAIARTALPGWRLGWAEPPAGPGETEWLLVLLRQASDWPSGRAAAWVDAKTGRLLEVRLPDGVDHARAWIRAFHEGRVFGEAHRWIVVFSGLAMVALSVIGLLLWRRSRRPVAAAAAA